MQTYRILPEAYDSAQRLLVRKVLVVAVPLILSLLVSSILPSVRSAIGLVVVLVVIGLLFSVGIGLAGLVIRSLLSQNRRSWLSYELTVDEDSVTRTQELLEPLRLERSDISKITYALDGGLLVQGRSRTSLIRIPRSLQGYEFVKEHLAQWHVIERAHSNRQIYILAGIGLCLAIGAFLAGFSSIYVGGVLLGLTPFFRNPALEPYFRSSRWWLLGMVPAIAFLFGTVMISIRG